MTGSDEGAEPRMPCREKASKDGLHDKEKEEFFRLLAQTGESFPEAGGPILEAFLLTEGHISPEYLQQRLFSQGIDVDLAAVSNILEVLCRYGIAQRVQLNGGGPWYEHLHLGADHDHLMCMRCGKIAEFDDPEFKARGHRVAVERHFEPLAYKLTILGLCPACRKREEPSMPLAMAARGEKLKIIRFAGGCQMQARLASMGLSVGDEVEVVNNSGPFIVNAKGTRLALGLGLAQKILVSMRKAGASSAQENGTHF